MHQEDYRLKSTPSAHQHMKIERKARAALIVLAYVAVFWLLLPAFLLTIGFCLDALLPISLGENLLVLGLGGWLVLSGLLLMIFTTVQLWVRGKGLPISHLPPSEFVADGCYKYVRHPIYVGYTAAFAGASILLHSFWSLAFSTPLLLIGWVVYALFYEEPVLIKRFGGRYRDYCSTTPLLLPIDLPRTLHHMVNKQLSSTRNTQEYVHSSVSSNNQRRGGLPDSERKHFIKVGLYLYILWIIAYEAVGRYMQTFPAHDLTCSLDRMCPLMPIFVWPYVFCYVFPFLLACVVTDWHRVNCGVLAMWFANLTAFMVYVAYPIAFPKPELAASISERLLALEYAADFHPGANNFPSLHVAFSWLVYFMCRKQGLSRTMENAIFLTALLITLSALLVKQHIVADVVTGILWAMAAWAAAVYFYPRWTEADADAVSAFRQMARRSVPFSVISAALIILLAYCR